MDYVRASSTMEVEDSYSVEVTISPVADSKTSAKGSTLGIFKPSFPGVNEEPALVSVDSDSESDSSCDDEEVAGGAPQSSLEATPYSEASSKTLTTNSGGDSIEPVDCLSDKFTSFFCPFDQAEEQPVNGDAKKTPSKSRDSDSCVMSPTCTEFQFEDILSAASSPGAELLASFQCWLKPSDEKKTSTARSNAKPQNRSGNQKMRSKYVKKLWKNWHPGKEIPLSRTKSTPAPPSASRTSDSLMDLCYDSDPGDEHTRRRKSMLESTLDTRSSKGKKRSYKDRRPASIGVGFGNMDRGFFCPPTPRNSSKFSPTLTNCYEDPHPPTPRHSAGNPSFFNDVPPSLSERDLLRPDKQADVKNFVQVRSLLGPKL
jgi:hypothetical protein